MIANLKGKLKAKGEDFVVVDVGGIGFKVYVPTSLVSELGGLGVQIELFTHLHVRENELALYGCSSEEELALFELLLSVPGVGPKVALAILSSLSIDSLRLAVAQERADMLARVPGIGMKMARKLIFNLRDKLEVKLAPAAPFPAEADMEVIEALTSLGYSVVEAQRALQSVPKEVTDVEEKLRLALSYFASR